MQPGANPPQSAEQNIETIARMEQDFLQRRTAGDRIADTITIYAGSFTCILLHFTFLFVWVLWNSGRIPAVRPFDPFPFILLTMLVSMEGVLLALFILTKQNRMSHWSDHRAHLNLQIALLSEKEVTKTIQMLETISRSLSAERTMDEEARELSQVTAVDKLADELERKMPKE